ncbi:MAG: CinA family protein [Proteobacteria bacterium]|nr:CinA family protein [Pseudomonadota bacterium]
MTASELVALLKTKKLMVATAESCTGGLVAAAITDVPGSSAVLDRGFVTYSNEAKTEMIGVPATLIRQHGAVSAEVAEAMARGAIAHSRADIAVAITGVAGPDGGSPEKPVGLVHFACARRDGDVRLEVRRFGPLGRDTIRLASVGLALELLAAAS